jgi:hypothetical protein
MAVHPVDALVPSVSPAGSQIPKSHQSALQSHHLEERSHHLVETLPPALRARLPQARRRLSQETLRDLIIDLCAFHPWSSRDLAALLGRKDHKPLVRDHLSAMVAEDLLTYTIPAMENHPDQRYTAAPGS